MLPSNPVLEQLGDYPLAHLQDLATEMRSSGPVADFSIGDPDEPTPPFVRAALVDAVTPSSRYPPASGTAALRRAVAAWVRRRHGVDVDPDRHVLATAGSKEAIFHLPLILIDPRSERRNAIWGDPGYPVYERGIVFAGGASDPVLLGADTGWSLDLAVIARDRLERAAVCWLNYPHNPTGATTTLVDLRRQLDVAREHGVVLCSDECYTDLWFDEPAPSLLEAADGDLSGALVFLSLSKRSGMTGYRSGAVVGDPILIDRLRTLRPNIGTASPEFVQAAATAAWSDDGHAEERRLVFAAKRAVVLPFLDEIGIEVSGSSGTFYVWSRAPGDDDVAHAERLLRERIIVSPGRAFGAAGRGWIRMALVPTVEQCVSACDAWRAAIDAGRLPS